MIFYLRSAECIFHGLHNSSCKKMVIVSWIKFRLSTCCLVTQYIVVFNVIWSCSNKPSSDMFSTERKQLNFSCLRDDITCDMYGCTASMLLSDLLFINNYERPVQGNNQIIWHCINIKKKDFLSLYRRNHYLSHTSIVQQHFWGKYFSQGYPTNLENYRNSWGWGGYYKHPLKWKF